MSQKKQDYVGYWASSWMFANAIGALFITPILFYLINLFFANSVKFILPKTVFTPVLCITIGISLGLFQWLVIRQWFQSKLWILATTASWIFGLFISGIVVSLIHTKILPLIPVLQLPPPLSFLFIATLFPLYVVIESSILGAVIGVSQWLILRKNIPKAKVWIGANIVASIFSNSMVARSFYPTLGNDVIARSIYLYPETINPLNIANSELLLMMIFHYGIITGIVLEKLFSNAQKSR